MWTRCRAPRSVIPPWRGVVRARGRRVLVDCDTPRSPVTVDTADGAARDALVADTPGRHRGYPEQPEANAVVVLETAGTFPELLVNRLCQTRM